MNVGLISVRYATALLQFATKMQAEKEVYEQAKFIIKVFSKTSNLSNALENPLVPKYKKRELLLYATGLTDVEEKSYDIFNRFINLLLHNHRESYMLNIMYEYSEQYCLSQNIHRGELITAIEIDEETAQSLINSIENKINGRLELIKKVDSEILGGFILQVDYYRWDASLKGQLNRIKKQYIERNRRII